MNASRNKSQKCCFCEKPITGHCVDGYCKKLKARVACEPCSQTYIRLRDNFGKRFVQAVTPAIDLEKLTESAQQNTLFADVDYGTIRVGQSEWRVTGKGAGYRARLRLKDNLEHCACTHKATRHVDDSQGNLLHCRDCDCDHFWYAVPAERRADLVVLSAACVSAEPSKLDKLQAVTLENGATHDEVIAAQRAIIALINKQAPAQLAA